MSPVDGTAPPPEPPTFVKSIAPQRLLPEGTSLQVVTGPDRGAVLALTRGRWIVGKGSECALQLSDPHVSREHIRVDVTRDGVHITDVGSTNGSYFHGARFDTLKVAIGDVILVGDTELRLVSAPTTGDRFGPLVGTSPAIKAVFTLLEKAAASNMPVLIQGETGTGKELAAEALHLASDRAGQPLIVCDLTATSADDLELELFGAVPGQDGEGRVAGAFRRAIEGTLVLNQVSELPLALQPSLLRALERSEIKPVRATAFQSIETRIIAITNQDLLAEVAEGRFREDLYHHLAVMRIEMPPLRERREDIPALVTHFLDQAALDRAPPTVPAETIAALAAHDWPGNVRELRNVLDRALSLAGSSPVLAPQILGISGSAIAVSPVSGHTGRLQLFKQAKDNLVDAWEKEYLTTLMDRAQGNVSLAARRAGLARPYLHELLRKHGINK